MLTFVEIIRVSFFYWIFVLKLYIVLCHQILVNLLTETGPFVYLTLGFFYWKIIIKSVYRYCTILKCAFHLLLASVEITQVSFLLKLYVVLIISLLSCKLTYRQCVFEEVLRWDNAGLFSWKNRIYYHSSISFYIINYSVWQQLRIISNICWINYLI